jgi:ABC-type nitrate/sulfonate/bicarbonate transport system permease component
MGRSRTLSLLLDPYVSVLYATPRVALIPLLIMIFGIDFQLRLSIVVLSSVFPILINTMNGVRNVDADLIETAVAFNANERQILRTVVMPATLPFVLSGVQIALGQAIIGVIVAEITVAISGIGGLIVEYGNAFRTNYMLVPILATSTISILLVTLLRLLERRLMPYRFPSARREPFWKRVFAPLRIGR